MRFSVKGQYLRHVLALFEQVCFCVRGSLFRSVSKYGNLAKYGKLVMFAYCGSAGRKFVLRDSALVQIAAMNIVGTVNQKTKKQ